VPGSGRNPAWMALVARPCHLFFSLITDQPNDADFGGAPV
jgi:hypothetical protein